MARSIPKLVLLAWLPTVSAADVPTGGGQVQMLIARVDGDQLTTMSTTTQTRQVVASDADGGTIAVPVTETVTTTIARELKLLKATDRAGKEVPTADLKSRLGSGGPIVFLTTPLDADWRKKFKPNTLFVEYVAPKADAKKVEEKK